MTSEHVAFIFWSSPGKATVVAEVDGKQQEFQNLQALAEAAVASHWAGCIDTLADAYLPAGAAHLDGEDYERLDELIEAQMQATGAR